MPDCSGSGSRFGTLRSASPSPCITHTVPDADSRPALRCSSSRTSPRARRCCSCTTTTTGASTKKSEPAIADLSRRWLATTRKTIDVVWTTARRTTLNPLSYTSAATTAAARHFCPPNRYQGLPEPDAGRLASPVPRGPGVARRRAHPTRWVTMNAGTDSPTLATTPPTRPALLVDASSGHAATVAASLEDRQPSYVSPLGWRP